MTPAQLDQALVVVRAVRPPHALPAQQPASEREARVDDERREHEYREPQRPVAGPPAEDAERCSEEAERDRAGVTHEHLRGREVEDEKGRCGCGDARRHDHEHRIAGEPGGERVGAEPEQRHAAGEPVGAVHEVVEVRHPHRREREDGLPHGVDVGGRRQDEHDRRERMRAEAERDRQMRSVVEVGDDREHGDERREDRLGAHEYERKQHADEDPDAPDARDGPLVQRAFVRVVEGQPVAALEQKQDHARAGERGGGGDEGECRCQFRRGTETLVVAGILLA